MLSSCWLADFLRPYRNFTHCYTAPRSRDNNRIVMLQSRDKCENDKGLRDSFYLGRIDMLRAPRKLRLGFAVQVSEIITS